MAIATHLGPWLLGTVKNTTGTTAGTIRNTGATVVNQTKAVAFGDAAATRAFVLPAGSLITGMTVLTTTVFDAATTMVISINGTASSAALAITTVANHAIVSNAAGTVLFANVGTTDAIATYTLTTAATAGASTLVVNYVVRNADGTFQPTAFTA
jgi:hypothetical protein